MPPHGGDHKHRHRPTQRKGKHEHANFWGKHVRAHAHITTKVRQRRGEETDRHRDRESHTGNHTGEQQHRSRHALTSKAVHHLHWKRPQPEKSRSKMEFPPTTHPQSLNVMKIPFGWEMEFLLLAFRVFSFWRGERGPVRCQWLSCDLHCSRAKGLFFTVEWTFLHGTPNIFCLFCNAQYLCKFSILCYSIQCVRSSHALHR